MPHLFDPITFRSVTCRNRVFVSPMCQYSSDRGLPNMWHVVHLGSRAVGGAGLVMVEASGVSPEGRITDWDSGIWSQEHAAAFAPILAPYAPKEQNLLLIAFSPDVRSLGGNAGAVATASWRLSGELSIPLLGVLILVVAVLIVTGLQLFLGRTRSGSTWRAASSRARAFTTPTSRTSAARPGSRAARCTSISRTKSP